MLDTGSDFSTATFIYTLFISVKVSKHCENLSILKQDKQAGLWIMDDSVLLSNII